MRGYHASVYTSVWKNFKSIFPYLSVFIIILGLLYEGLYYWYFNIDIQDYVGVSELLLTVSKVAVNVTALTLIFFVLVWLHETAQIFKPKNKEQFEITLKPSLAFLILFDALLTLLMVAIMFFPFLSIIQKIYLLYGIVTGLITLLVKQFTGKYLNQNIKAVILVALVLVTFFTLLYGYIQSTEAEKGQYTGTKIYTKDSTYVSDSTHFYIGKTTNFYFIYNKDRQAATIIPEREVNRFELKKNTISPRLIIIGK